MVIDYLDELEPYLDCFYKYKLQNNKLLATSPFRHERKPSFAVNLDNGTWVDSGAVDEQYYKGNFISLLSFFRGETYIETEYYLSHKYNLFNKTSDELRLDIQLNTVNNALNVLDLNMLSKYENKHDYLTNRGINDTIQELFNTGYCKENNAVTIPHRDINGRLINIKFRKVTTKHFMYLQEGNPVKSHLYGLYFVEKMSIDTVAIVEGEVDCLYLWSNGIPAVATSGAYLTEKQLQLLIKSHIKTIILATDNDNAGNRFQKQLINNLYSKFDLQKVTIPDNKKDVNDMNTDELIDIFRNKTVINLQFTNLKYQ